MRSINVIFLSFLTAIFALKNVTGQVEDISLYQYSVRDGLSQSTVTCMTYDKEGLLWVGTGNGFNRILGEKIEVVSRQFKLLNSIPIRSLSSESREIMLVGTEAGAYELNLSAGLLKPILLNGIEINDKMMRVFSVSHYRLFFARENSMVIEDRITGNSVILQHQISEGAKKVCQSENRLYWISDSPQGIYYFDGVNGSIQNLMLPEKWSKSGFNSISVTPNIGIVISNETGVLINWFNDSWIDYSPDIQELNPQAKLHSAVLACDSSIFINYLLGGCFRFSPEIELLNSYSQVYFSKGNRTYNLYLPTYALVDYSGNVFLGTDGNGLIRINPDIKKFDELIPSTLIGGKLKDNFVTSVYQNNAGVLYFGCLNTGLSVYDQVSKKGSYYDLINTSNQVITQIQFITPYKDIILLGTSQGLYTFGINRKISEITLPGIRQNYTCYFQIADNKFILGAESGLYLFQNEQIKKINSGLIDQISFIECVDSTHFLIAERGCKMFLMEFNSNDTLFTPINISLSNNQIKPAYNGMVKVGNSFFVASTFGLLELDHNMNFIRKLDSDQGFSSSLIYSIRYGNDDKIWLSTNGGISSYDPKSSRIVNYGCENGVQSNEFNSGVSFQAEDGTILFGGVSGINSFNPIELKGNINHPKIWIESIFINEKKVNVDSLLNLNSIKIGFNKSSITFILKPIEYTLPEKTTIEYMLIDIDPMWIKTGLSGIIRYAYLPAGKYKFIARTCNSEQSYSDVYNIISFEVLPPFYKMTWFILISLLLIIGLIAIIFHLFYLNIERKKIVELKQLKEIENIRMQISKEIHDDIGAGLTQISIISEQLSVYAKEDNRLWISSKLNKLIEISRELIQNMNEIVWVINPNNDSLERLLVYLRINANRMLEETDFDFEVDFPDILPSCIINSKARRKLVLIVKEAINNSVKHSGGSLIRIYFGFINENNFKLIIGDNGKGLPIYKSDLGNGLKNIEYHAAELGMDIQWFNNNGLEMILTGKLEQITINGG